MNKKEEEIQRKLLELETTVLKENTDLSLVEGRTDLTVGAKHAGKSATSKDEALTKSDGAYFGGLGLIILGLIMVFQHINVGSGLLGMLGLGSGGFLVLFLPLMIGIGMMLFNSKNKWGWLITAGSCVFLIFSVLASLTMTFKAMSLLQMIVLFLPFAIGGSLLVKGMGGPKGVVQAIKSNMPEKSE
ncbi:MAG: hypothetical protein HY986_18165 [Candidatus Melainabacteria bacterium]|nr:hypothetical protein [Candidatus Melainabacteria bacterium]